MASVGGGAASGGSRPSGSPADSARSNSRSGGSRGGDARDSRDPGTGHLCTFQVGGQKYALSTTLVRELVEVTAITPVPRTAPAVLGLFNLRGEPMPLVDLSLVLGSTAATVEAKSSAIILRSAHMSVGARIDALGTVVPNRSVIPTDDPNPLILGFLDSPGEAPIAVVDPIEFMSRIENLKLSSARAPRDT